MGKKNAKQEFPDDEKDNKKPAGKGQHSKNARIQFADDDIDKNHGGAGGYIPKQSLDPKIFMNDASAGVVPDIKNDDFCASCFASPLKSCQCGKMKPPPKADEPPQAGSGGGGKP